MPKESQSHLYGNAKAPSAVPASWRVATISDVVREAENVKSFVLESEGFGGFKPGQHIDVRLTAPDGYQAQRSYSISSAPEEGTQKFRITVELMENGEVSSFMHGVVQKGDKIEARGPFGGPFTWTSGQGGPVLFAAGGSGIAPVMSMLTHRACAKSKCKALLLYSSRTFERIIFRDEIAELESNDSGLRVIHTLTRSHPSDWSARVGRIDQEMVNQAAKYLINVRRAYVCGSTPFVESVADMIVNAGIDPMFVATERFGASG